MANRIVSVHAGIYGMGIYAIMLPSSGFSVAHWNNIKKGDDSIFQMQIAIIVFICEYTNVARLNLEIIVTVVKIVFISHGPFKYIPI